MLYISMCQVGLCFLVILAATFDRFNHTGLVLHEGPDEVVQHVSYCVIHEVKYVEASGWQLAYQRLAMCASVCICMDITITAFLQRVGYGLYQHAVFVITEWHLVVCDFKKPLPPVLCSRRRSHNEIIPCL